MNNTSILTVGGFTLFFAAFAFIHRRQTRIADFFGYREDIWSKSGCKDALFVFDDVLHIMEHYGAQLNWIGYSSLQEFHNDCLWALHQYIRPIEEEYRAVCITLEFFELGKELSPDERVYRKELMDNLPRLRDELVSLETQRYKLKARLTQPVFLFLLHLLQFSYMLFLLCSRRNLTKTRNLSLKRTARLPRTLRVTLMIRL